MTSTPPAARADSPVTIDWTRCDGHGVCIALAPGLFAADPWGFPIARTEAGPAPSAATVKRVVACCPALALRENRDASVLQPRRDHRKDTR